MSVQAIAWVLERSQSKGARRCVLIAIANHVDASTAKGWAYVDQILAEANCSEDTYRRAVDDLEEAGELEVEVRGGGGARMRDAYRPNLFCLPQYELTLAPRRPRAGDARPPQDAEDSAVASPPRDAGVRPPQDAQVGPLQDAEVGPSRDAGVCPPQVAGVSKEEPSFDPSVEPSLPRPAATTSAGAGGERGPGLGEDEADDDPIEGAFRVLAYRELDRQPAGSVRTPSRWMAHVIARLKVEHFTRARRVLDQRPETTADELADHLSGVRAIELPALPPPPDRDEPEPLPLSEALARARAATRPSSTAGAA